VTVARRRDAYRKLVAGGHTYLWRVRHSHAEPECQEIVILRRYGSPGRARIVFRAGPGRLVGDGAYLHRRAVLRTGSVPGGESHPGGETRSGGEARPGGETDPGGEAYLNLNRPGVARALLDEALAAGWEPGEEREFDGWEMIDATSATG
jgi:hypothetical protein